MAMIWTSCEDILLLSIEKRLKCCVRVITIRLTGFGRRSVLYDSICRFGFNVHHTSELQTPRLGSFSDLCNEPPVEVGYRSCC